MRMLALLAAGLFAGTLVAADDKKDPPKKEERKDEKKAKDEESILGTWKIEKFDSGGGADGPPADELAKVRMTFKKDGKLSMVEPDEKEHEGTFTLDPAAKPKTLDIEGGKRPKAKGLYELDGDTLKVAMAHGGEARPTEMKADGKGVVVITLKRVKDEKKDK